MSVQIASAPPFPRSSEVEQMAVNHKVVRSIRTVGAISNLYWCDGSSKVEHWNVAPEVTDSSSVRHPNVNYSPLV